MHAVHRRKWDSGSKIIVKADQELSIKCVITDLVEERIEGGIRVFQHVGDLTQVMCSSDENELASRA